MSTRIKKITTLSILITIGMILGYIENFINIVPVSGVKIGLSNVVLLYCIYKFTFTESLLVVA